MVDRTSGRASYTLDPYQVSLSFAARQAGAGGDDWFGPLSPIAPTAPADVAGRQWDYPAGYNLALEPRPYSPVSFVTLRQLADGWDLLRLVIETRKDQIARLAWSIKPRAASGKPDARCAAITAFLTRPDGIHGWADWLRLLLEELLVIDAATLYCRRTRNGRLSALLPIDGATIKPVIDAWGRTPQPETVDGRVAWPTAYQQVLKGFPAVDYTTRDLIYRPRNVRVNRAYGYSPVEQVVTTVNIALRRQLFLLEYFTEGNIPDSLIGVPEGWTPDQIASYQKYWDTYFSGDSGRRRRAKFVPGAAAHSFVQTKEPELKSAFDDWLARLVCFAFSISPQALVSQMNRATAEVQKTLAEEEGFAPLLAWMKALIDDVIAAEFDGPDLEFAWTPTESVDPAQQEAVLSSYTSRGILTLNEARAALGREPLADPAADRPMALTGTGYVGLVATATATKLARSHEWQEDQHPRWPTGSSDHQGGRFAPADAGHVLGERLALTGPCKKEWLSALVDCEKLLKLPEFHPDRSLLGGHTTGWLRQWFCQRGMRRQQSLMFDFQLYKTLLQRKDWTAIYKLLDDAREKAVTPEDVSCEVAFRVSTLREQRRYSDALALLKDRGHLYTSQASATHDMARILLQLGRGQDALDVMSSSPYEMEMNSCPIQATDAKFFHAVLLAKSGDPSARERLEGIPDDYIQVTVDGDDLITKSEVVALIDNR